MILGLEIGMLVMGLIALFTGKMKLAKGKVATGLPARLAGLVFLMPLPLAFAVGFAIAFLRAVANKPTDRNDLQLTLALVEGGIALACLLIGLGIAYFSSQPQAKERPPSIDDLPEVEPAPYAEGVQQAPTLRGRSAPRSEAPDRPVRRQGVSPAVWVIGGVGLVGTTLLGAFLVFAHLVSSPQPNPTANRPNLAPQPMNPDPPRQIEREKKAPPPPAQKDPPRPKFGDEHAYRESLAKGRVYQQVRFGPNDPLDRDQQHLARLILVELEANRGYLAESFLPDSLPNPAMYTLPPIRLEELDGKPAAASALTGGHKAGEKTVSRLFFQPKKGGTYRFVVVEPPGRPPEPYYFLLRPLRHDELQPDIGKPAPREVSPSPPLRIARRVEPFLTGGFSPRGDAVWLVDEKAQLRRFGLPDFKDLGKYTTERPIYRIALDDQGRLFALVERGAPTPRPEVGVKFVEHKRGLADLHVYDTTKLPADGGKLTPVKVVPIGGLVSELLLSSDGRWLYYLDSKNRKVVKLNARTAAVERETSAVQAGAAAITLTPNGRTLYIGGTSNYLEQLDSETLEVKKTIRLARGKPTALAATDGGYVFLKPSEAEGEKNIQVVNANPNYGGNPAEPVMWAAFPIPPYSFVLSHDQRWLYVHAKLGFTPNSVTAYHVSDWPLMERGWPSGELSDNSIGSWDPLIMSRDGKYFLLDQGVILSAGP